MMRSENNWRRTPIIKYYFMQVTANAMPKEKMKTANSDYQSLGDRQ